jgi:hypothetical protein
MIRSLEDAERWYRAVKSLAVYVKRIAGLWDEEAIAEVLGRDNRLREVTSAELTDKATTVLQDLNDLGVLVLFSVFEATVRARTEADIEREMAELRHPAVVAAVKDLKDAIQNGSFAKITTAYKQMDPDLTEKVNQVRTFRNWVAHGRRGELKNNVDPDEAVARLRGYLGQLQQFEFAVTSPIVPAGDAPADDTGSDAAKPATAADQTAAEFGGSGRQQADSPPPQ